MHTVIETAKLERLIDRIEDLESFLAAAGHEYGFDPAELEWVLVHQS
jgi:hypothetical protein